MIGSRNISVLLLLALFSAPLFADGEFGAEVGLTYQFNDAATYPEPFTEPGFPQYLLPFRLATGVSWSSAGPDLRFGSRIQLVSLAGSVGCQWGLPQGPILTVGEPSGFLAGLRFGWEPWHLSVDALMGDAVGTPEWRVALGTLAGFAVDTAGSLLVKKD